MARSIVIVGGGTAGWMTAAYLTRALGKGVQITVVESDRIQTIGVGEATFSTVKLFFDFLGLEEQDWMPSCNAAYKLAIKFVDWTASRRHFYHPFQRYDVVDGFNLAEWWLKLKRGREPFDYACFTIPAICDHERSPRFFDGRVFDDRAQQLFDGEPTGRGGVLSEHKAQLPYAYHFDAGLLAAFLQDYAVRRGVRRIVDDVVGVELGEDGAILRLATREHGALGGELFVDCTGFRGLLINQALGEPFVSFSRSLLCDSAVALQVPADSAAEMEPYTTATALAAGWVWKIPLYGRLGTGYVYASAFLSRERAEAELRRHLGPAADGCTANHIQMRIGRCRNSWVKNCVAIGLASGFVEPLESTGIFFIQHGIEELVSHLHFGAPDAEMIASYNRAVAECIDGVRDFLVLHYWGSDRADDAFWQATKRETAIPESLEPRLRLWKTRLPNPRNVNPCYHGFESYSYSVMLLGLGSPPVGSLPALDYFDSRHAAEAFQAVKRKAERLVAELPSQYDYLTQMRARARGLDLPPQPAPPRRAAQGAEVEAL
ncbi:MAG TPA: tryptophan halogenase family protein [Solirubrobacterales bacterium]|nr:tryptophan halogenase family protein [Solirubrobacterales bacterium]